MFNIIFHLEAAIKMKPSLAATLVMIFSSVLANPAPRKCNKQHLMDPPVFTRAEEPSFYVMNPEVPYPYHFHHDVNPYNRHQENMAAAQIRTIMIYYSR